MANEAVKVELTNTTGFPRRYTVADGTGIPKGTLLELTDPRTVKLASTNNCALGGIAAFEKVASDGSTSISAWTDGIFEMVASGSITIGHPVKATGGSVNKIEAADAADIGAQILGYSLETATDGETINVRVRL